MNLSDLFSWRRKPRWMNQETPPYGYGGKSPRTDMRVIMCCNKCEEKVQEELQEVDGVQEVFTDQARSEVVVYGHADAHDVVKKARKVDKRADILFSDSFTFHHSRHSHKHDRGHFSDYSHGHGHSYNGRSNRMPIESVGSPRYNSSFNQSSSYDSRHHRADLQPSYRQSFNQYRPRDQLENRHMHDWHRSEPELRRYHHNDMYRRHEPDFIPSMYGDYRPEHEHEREHEHEHRHRYNGYRPSQSYPPSYVDGGDFRDSPYPGAMMNPDYMKPLAYY